MLLNTSNSPCPNLNKASDDDYYEGNDFSHSENNLNTSSQFDTITVDPSNQHYRDRNRKRVRRCISGKIKGSAKDKFINHSIQKMNTTKQPL